VRLRASPCAPTSPCCARRDRDCVGACVRPALAAIARHPCSLNRARGTCRRRPGRSRRRGARGLGRRSVPRGRQAPGNACSHPGGAQTGSELAGGVVARERSRVRAAVGRAGSSAGAGLATAAAERIETEAQTEAEAEAGPAAHADANAGACPGTDSCSRTDTGASPGARPSPRTCADTNTGARTCVSYSSGAVCTGRTRAGPEPSRLGVRRPESRSHRPARARRRISTALR
jgi:hypothetical protein